MRKTYQSAMNKVRLEEDRKQELLEQIYEKIEYKQQIDLKETGKRVEHCSKKIPKEAEERRYLYMLEKKGKWIYKVVGAFILCCVCLVAIRFIGLRNADDKNETTKPDDLIATEEIEEEKETIGKEESMEERTERISNEMEQSNLGVRMPELVYLSNDIAMIHDYIGFLIYDRKTKKVIQAIDTKAYGINQVQGEDYTNVSVSKDGAFILFVNMQSEQKRYLYHVAEDYLEQTTQTTLEESYNEVIVRGSEKDTEHVLETINPSYDGIIGQEYIKTEDGTCWFLMLTDTSNQKLSSLALVETEISEGNIIIFPIFDGVGIGTTEKINTSDYGLQTQKRHYLWEYDGWKYYYCNWTLEEAIKEGFWNKEMGRFIESYGRIEREKEDEIQIIETLVENFNNFSRNSYSIPRILDADDYIIYTGSETPEPIDMKRGTLIVIRKDGTERNCYPNWNKGSYFYDNNYIYYSNSWQMKEEEIRICRMNMDFSEEMLWNEVEGNLLSVKDGYGFYIKIIEEENESRGVIDCISLKQYYEKPIKQPPIAVLNLTELEMDHYETMEMENLYAITEKTIYSKDYVEPIEFTIYNETYETYQIQEDGVYDLEIKIGGYWYQIKTTEQKQTENITKTIQPNQTYKTVFHLTDYIENAEQRLIGQYRIVKTLQPEQENLEPVVIIAEFMIQ